MPPGEPAPGASSTAPRLGDAVRVGFTGFVEEITIFLLANVAWAVLVGGVVYAVGRSPVGLLLTPLVAPLTSGLARIAAEVSRQRVVSIRTLLDGVRDRFWTKMGLGAVHVLVLLLAFVDLLLAPSIGGLAAVASMILAIYVAIASTAYGLVFWTVISDRDLAGLPVRQAARLALAVVLRRPGAVAFLFAFGVLSVAVMSTLVVPVLFLPSIVLITVAAYVIPAAEEIRRRGSPPRDRPA